MFIQDLVSLAILLAIAGIDAEAMDECRLVVDRARRLRNTNRPKGNGQLRLARYIAKGAADPEDTFEKEVSLALHQWVSVLRVLYADHIIRRTIDSVDNLGQPISGLPVYHDIPIILKLSDEEMDVQRLLAEDLVTEGAHIDNGNGAVKVRVMLRLHIFVLHSSGQFLAVRPSDLMNDQP